MSKIILQNLSLTYQGKLIGKRELKPPASDNVGATVDDSNGHFRVAALHHINLAIKDGERVGLIGHNGSGKTTLLKVMAGVLPPSDGTIRVEGRITSLLHLRAGMMADLSGLENILIRATLMGLSSEQTDQLIEDVKQFSELGLYLNMPIRTYSAGMAMRLSFAIATGVTPEILIMDEWIGAGDQNFRKKAQERMKSFTQKAGILVLASHIVPMIDSVCTRRLTLENGEIVKNEVKRAKESQGEKIEWVTATE